MKKTAEAIIDLGREARREREVRFFGAFRSRGSQRWDIVLAVPGLPPDEQGIYSFVARLMRTYAPMLGSQNLGRVVAMDVTDPRIFEAERVADGRRRITNFDFGGVEVAEAYLLRPAATGAAV